MSNQLKLLVNSYYDLESSRIVMGNRLKKKKDGTLQKVVNQENYAVGKIDFLEDLYTLFEMKEKELEKQILNELKNYKIYTEFLKGVKGCGTLLSGILLSNFDIEKATTVSKFYAFAGICKGLIKGKKWDAKKKVFIETDDLIQRDKLTGGYCSPFNKNLRSKLLGVLAGSFLKCQSSYSIYYYNYKNRKEQEFKGNKEYTKMRIHRMSNRYMIKMFLSDFWLKWREIEGLPIRCSYAEEYLNKVHFA